MPPLAFTPISGPTVRRMSEMSCGVAPPPAKPEHVFTKSAPAFFESWQAMTFSSSVRRLVSMMHLRTVLLLDARRTALMSSSTSLRLPDFRAPTLMTMSSSDAPSAMQRLPSKALARESICPSGKPITAATLTGVPWSFCET